MIRYRQYKSSERKIVTKLIKDFYKEFPYLDKVANQGVAFDIKPIGSEAYTLRTYPSHKQIDPLTGFFNILSALSSDDAVFIKLLYVRLTSPWKERAEAVFIRILKKKVWWNN